MSRHNPRNKPHLYSMQIGHRHVWICVSPISVRCVGYDDCTFNQTSRRLMSAYAWMQDHERHPHRWQEPAAKVE